MVRGANIKIRVRLKNSLGEPTPESIVSDIQLDLYSTADKSNIAKSVKLSDGVTKESSGVYIIEISGDDTIKLPKTGSALLEGWLMPVKKKVVYRLGQIKDNIKNG
jgi:hypothetical protein